MKSLLRLGRLPEGQPKEEPVPGQLQCHLDGHQDDLPVNGEYFSLRFLEPGLPLRIGKQLLDFVPLRERQPVVDFCAKQGAKLHRSRGRGAKGVPCDALPPPGRRQRRK